MSDQVQLTIDGDVISVPKGTTIFDAARMQGISIPTLCHQQNETPVGVCRVCVVDVGGRVFAASCVRALNEDDQKRPLVVSTNSEKVRKARKTLVELLMSDHPSPCARQRHSGDCELETMAKNEGVGKPRFPRRISPRGQDNSSLVIAVDHEACILCDRCIRGCDEIRENNVFVRRMHGLLSHGSLDEQERYQNRSAWRAGGCRRVAAAFVLPEDLGNVPGA